MKIPMFKTELSMLEHYISVSAHFFESVGGNIFEIHTGSRKNIEIIDTSEAPYVTICTIYVCFSESQKFGCKNFLDSYKRYRQMRYDWWSYLESNGFAQWDMKSKIIGHFVPLLTDDNHPGSTYPTEKQTAYGSILKQYKDYKGQNPYYDEAHHKYGVQWLLQDRNQIVIGPDLGLLYTLVAASQQYSKFDTFVDIGAGTGELSAYLINNNQASQIIVNEISPHLHDHLRSFLKKAVGSKSVGIEYQFFDANELLLPNRVDIISMGIYYGAQPQFIKKNGEKVKNALGNKGVMIIQSGMIEGAFNVAAVTGCDVRLFDWPWYSERYTLTEYFNAVKSIVVANEVITIASNDHKNIDAIIQTLNKNVEPAKKIDSCMSKYNVSQY